MANDKKFIVKNGLLTPQNAVIGSTTDTGEKLQVTGSSKLSGDVTITQTTAATPSIEVTNSGGYLQNSIIASFKGDSDGLEITNSGQGDYTIQNTQQNNGITFYDGTAGVRIAYNGSPRLDITSTGNKFYGLSTTNIDGNRILTTADEGPGNGLDADTVDGLEASQFLRSDVDDTAAGNIIIQQDLTVNQNVSIGGDLTVSGNTTYVDTETILLSDNIITLNANHSGAPTQDAGWEVNRGSSANSGVLWDETNDWFRLNSAGTNLGRIITTADEGPGNGFDADTVDGLEGDQFLRSDVDDTANGNITILGNLIVGDNVGGAEITLDGSGQDRRIYSDQGEIGFLDATFNYAAKSDTNSNWIVDNDVSAGANVFATNNIIAGDNVTANSGYVSAATYVIAGTTVTAGTDVFGQRFVDADNNSYFANPAGSSVFNDLGIDDDLFHNGDTDTKLSFSTDQIDFHTGGLSRLGIADTEITATVDFYAPDVYVNDDIVHNGDTDTKVNFTTDTIKLNTGGSTRLTANNSGVFVDNLSASGDITAGGDVTGNNVIATNGAYAPRFYDSDDNNYYADPAGDSQFNTVDIDDYLRHRGDTNTYLGFDTNDNIVFNTAGAERLEINATNITGTVDGIFPNLFAARYYDSQNATYYGDFASTSRINDISLVGEIIHDGDTNTFIHFNTDDSVEVQTGGAQRLLINNTYVLATNQMRSPIFYDSNNTAYYGDFAATSQMSQIDIDSYIRHRGDTNTYMGFDAADSITFVTGGAERVNITDSNTTFYQPVIVQGDIQADRFVDRQNTSYYLNPADTSTAATLNGKVLIGNVTDAARWDDNTGNGGISLMPHGSYAGTQSTTVGISGNVSGGYSLMYLNLIDSSSNPTGNGQRYIHFYHDGTDGGSIRGDSTGNLYQVLKSGTTWGFWTSGFSEALIVDDNANIMLNTGSSPTYTDGGDNTPLVAAIDAAKVHVGGSIYLNDANAGIIFGRGTASFLRDEELGFGWGSGWYMTDASYLRVRNNTTVYSTGDAWFNRVYAQQNQSYYLDPDGDSQFNTVDIDDYIRHRGDTNTYIGFPAADTFKVFTNGNERLNIDNNSADFTINVYAPRYYDSNDNAFYADPAGTSIFRRLNVYSGEATGELNVGRNANERFRHYITDGIGYIEYYQDETDGTDHSVHFNIVSGSSGANIFQFNRPIVLTSGQTITASRFIDSDDTRYYLDPNATGNAGSNAGFFGGNLSFGLPGNGTANNTEAQRGRWLSIEGNADTSGEGSARIFFTEHNSTTGSMSAYGMSLGYRGGATSIVGSDGNTWTGLGQINNGEWGLWGHDASATGQWAMKGPRSGSFVVASGSFRAPIFYDSNNTNYYVDPNSSSRMDTIVLNDGVTLRSPNGDYGSFAITGQARNGWEGFSINDRMVFMHDNSNTVGVYNDVDNEWIWYADRNAQMRLMYNGGEQARTENGYFLANNQIRSPIFYDSNDTAYYVNPNGSSRINTIQALRYYLNHNTTYYLDQASGDYGSVKTGGATGGWSGYAIENWWVFMADGVSNAGIFNDTDNEWAILARRNAEVELYYNGIEEATTASGYFLANNQMRAPIYYDSQNTAYFLNPAAGNTAQALKINGKIYRDGFASGDGNNNKLLETQDRSHWIWNTATDWGIFWAGDTNPYRSYFSTSNPNEIVFIGNGNLRASIDLDDGRAHFTGVVSAPDFALNGGNENVSLNPAYGSGGADLVLFDMTKYFEARVIQNLSGSEDYLTPTTSEYVKNSDGPFAGSYVLRTSAYRTFDSDYIPVAPGEDIYGEVSARYISGSGGLLYFGVRRYDKDKRPIAGNDGITYFVTGGNNVTHSNWVTYRGHTTIPATHTPYNGSDGAACRFVRLILLVNYNTGGALREIGGVMLKRRNVESNLLVDDIVADDILADDIVADTVDANVFRDRGNTAFYLDPANTGVSARLRGRIDIAGDNNDTWMDMQSASAGYARIRMRGYAGDPMIEFSDASQSGGQDQVWAVGADDRATGSFVIRFNGSTLFPTDWTSAGTERFQLRHDGNLSLSGGEASSYRLQVGGTAYASADMRSPIFYDSDNTGYYGNFASTSNLYRLQINNEQAMLGGAPIYFYTSSGSLRGYIRATETNDEHLQIATSGGEDIVFKDGGFSGDWNVIMRGNGDTLFRSQIQTPIMYDRDNTGFYINPNGNSNISTMDFDRIDGPSTSNRDKIRVYDSSSYTIGMQSGITFGGLGDWAMTFQFNNDDDRGFWWGDTSHGTNAGAMSLTTNGRLVVARALRVGFGEGDTSAPNYVLDVNGPVYTNSDMYANRYYDRNNTFYYGDFASTNRFNATENYGKVYFYARQTDSGGSSGYVTGGKVDEYLNNVAAEFHSGNDDPITIYFRSGVNAPSDFGYITFDPDYDNSGEQAAMVIGVENDGTGSSDYIRLQGRTWVDSDLVSSDNTEIMRWLYRGSTYGILNTDYLYHSSDVRSPIFYDSNDTGYYVNPASTTQLHYVLANNWFRPQGATGLYFQSYGHGLWPPEGEGNPYGNVATYGGGRNGWRGYGIGSRWTLMSTNGNNWGMHDNTRSWNFYYNGSYHQFNYGYVYSPESFRAPIFYDSNNTAYYFNGASDNSTRFRGVNNETMAFMALPGHTRNSAEYYRARPRITGDTNYWTGAMGWGRVDMNAVATWGSGFIDSWSSPPNQPSGTSHWVGVQAFHYRSSNTAGYGWQMVGGPVTNLRFRSSWSAWRSWRTIPILDENSTNGGAMYAGIYYDSNNTGYYANPNSTSNFYRLQLVNELHVSTGNGTGVGIRLADDGDIVDNNDGWATMRFSNGVIVSRGNRTNGARAYIGADGNTQATSSLRAPIFYDRNDTGYYLDPNTTSNSALRIRGGTLHGPNPTWGAYLWVGTNGRPNSWASVCATNGNLHLDCQNGRAMYLNYYSGNIIYGTDFRPYIIYDRNNTGYYVDPDGTSRLNQLNPNRINSPYAGGNSGITRSSSPYSFGFQESGGWSYPYPDLVLQYHTGMSFAGNPSYGGMRFFNDYNSGTVRFQINGSSSYTFANTWLQVGGGGVGIYDGYNGAHFYPNNATNYGSWNFLGSRSGWRGIAFSDAGYDPHLMWDSSGNGGWYHEDLGRWLLYHSRSRNCTGVASSSTVSGYRMRVNGSLYCNGNIVAYSDRRKKKNIVTIDNALDKVLQLRGVYYERKEDLVDERDDLYKGRQLGMIAQEVQEIVPEVVSYAEELDEYALDYPKMVGLLVEAHKDQQEIINNQQEQIDELKKLVNTLMEKL